MTDILHGMMMFHSAQKFQHTVGADVQTILYPVSIESSMSLCSDDAVSLACASLHHHIITTTTQYLLTVFYLHACLTSIHAAV